MTKHRLMLSAATAALLAAPLFPAAAQKEISGSNSSAQDTSTDGDITIDAGGAVSIKSSKAAVTINSNNFVSNAGTISNTDTSNAVGVQITTVAGTPIVSPSGFVDAASLSMDGSGGSKTGIWVTGGGSYVGPITLLSTAVTSVTGDSSAVFLLDSGTTMNGDLTLSGSITQMPTTLGSTSSTAGASVIVSGTMNGNVLLDSSGTISNIGQGARGVLVLGSINPCNSSTGATCAATDTGSFVNAGSISVNGVQIASRNLPNPESGSAVAIGGSIAGGINNAGPTSAGSTVAAASITGNGIASAPVFLISPTVQGTAAQTPITIGVYTADTVDPGYSFYNRGSISATPVDPNISASAVVISGASPTAPLTMTGGIFSSGLISAAAGTNELIPANTPAPVTATALTIGQFTTVPKLTVSTEAISGVKTTSGSISASVSGIGGGVATALSIQQNASMPEIDLLAGSNIRATSTTPTLAPTQPVLLEAFGIDDLSGNLLTVNNAGTITAGVSALTPTPNIANVVQTEAIFMGSNTTGHQTINNSGAINADVVFGTVGNDDVLNVGNVGAGGAPNPATGVANTSANVATVNGTIDFGSGGTPTDPQRLNIGAWGSVTGPITSTGAVLDVDVEKNGLLNVQNTTSTQSIVAATGSLQAHNFDVNGGTLAMTISQSTGGAAPIILASNEATITSNSQMQLSFGSFVSSPDPLHPVQEQITLVSAPTLNLDQTTVNNFNTPLSQNLPFLFEADPAPLSLGTSGSNHTLVLSLTPKTPAELGLTGDALAVYSKVVPALALDPQLGAALATGVINTTTAQSIFSQFTPDVSGGSRAVAIMITDQGTGPVAARQRLLRNYANQEGELTLWTQEYAASINNKGVQEASGDITGYKDHGFGFALGMDSGSAADGWYGGALSFYSGDIDEAAPRDSQTEAQWYMLTGYTDWRGKHLFLDTQATIGYGSLVGKRTLVTPTLDRQADGKRSGLLAALGATAGAVFNYGSFSVTPHVSLDGLTMREDGYAEDNGGNGLDLAVTPYYANSFRAFVGTDVAENIDLGDFSLKPEGRIGYRYDFLADPVKLRAGFSSIASTTQTDPLSAANSFTLTSPDPEKGDLLGGISLSALAESWSLSLNYDWIRGSHGSTSQVASFSLLGRI